MKSQNTSRTNDIGVKISIDDIISRLDPVRQKSSYAVWSSLAYFPTLFIFYTSGLTALCKKDFALLRKLFSIQTYNPYREGQKVSILKTINADEIIEKALLNKVYNKNQIVPHSELLYQYLKPLFDQWMVNDEEFDEPFDAFELLYSLLHIKIIGKVWFPLGRYIHRRRSNSNNIYIKLEESKNSKRIGLDKGVFLKTLMSYMNVIFTLMTALNNFIIKVFTLIP